MKKGFTLIELLVVIAIISLLSSVVLASLRSANNKAINTSAQANMGTIMKQMALLYENAGGSYVGVCSDNIVRQAISAGSAGSWATTDTFTSDYNCTNASTAKWMAVIKLKTGGGWLCTDASSYYGTIKVEPSAPALVASDCP